MEPNLSDDEEKVFNVAKSDNKGLRFRHISQPAKELVEYIDDKRLGKIKPLKTPWKKLNEVMGGGLEFPMIISVAGMSGSGKTAIINQLETGLKDLNPTANFSILSFNFEMLATKLIGRKLSSRMDKTTTELYSGNEKYLSDADFARVKDEIKQLEKYEIYYVDRVGTVEQIKNTILAFCLAQKNKDPDKGTVVFLDHSLLVAGKRGDLEREILMDLMATLNDLKKGLKVSFVILSQLNRSIEGNDRIVNPELQAPRKSDLFGSEALYIFSDIVLISHRPEMLGLKVYTQNKWPTKDAIFWHLLKVREGEPCVALMKNDLQFSRVVDGN